MRERGLITDPSQRSRRSSITTRSECLCQLRANALCENQNQNEKANLGEKISKRVRERKYSKEEGRNAAGHFRSDHETNAECGARA